MDKFTFEEVNPFLVRAVLDKPIPARRARKSGKINGMEIAAICPDYKMQGCVHSYLLLARYCGTIPKTR